MRLPCFPLPIGWQHHDAMPVRVRHYWTPRLPSSWSSWGCGPLGRPRFPLSDHQTGRADFPHGFSVVHDNHTERSGGTQSPATIFASFVAWHAAGIMRQVSCIRVSTGKQSKSGLPRILPADPCQGLVRAHDRLTRTASAIGAATAMPLAPQQGHRVASRS
jgi:hypothetical protein